MFDRSLLSNEKYQQTGDFCVLGSYAVAMKPFLTDKTNFDVLDFFKGYCEEMDCVCKSQNVLNAIGWERAYLADFSLKTSTMSGYELIKSLHKNSDVSPFKEARTKVDVTASALDQASLPNIEKALNDAAKRVLAIVCVNHDKVLPQTASFACSMPKHHSVVVGYDGKLFFAYDVNHGGQLIELGQSINALEPGDCLLFTEKVIVTV